MKVNINGSGHMTKMAAMAINSKNLINLIFQKRKTFRPRPLGPRRNRWAACASRQSF